MAPSAWRTALMTGPGPEGGGSKNSISRPHWPERLGRGEPLSAAIAGATNAATEKMNVIVLAESRRGDRMRIPDISSSLFDLRGCRIATIRRAGEVNNSCVRKRQTGWDLARRIAWALRQGEK